MVRCCLVQLRYNFRVYPTPGQQIELARAFGCARVVFNDGLRLRQQAREAGEKYVSDAELSKRVITQAKSTPERAWLGEVSAVVLQQALADLNTAYRNFFASIAGKRKGRKVAPPRFRSRKDNRQAIRFTRNSRFKVLDNGRLRLPKIGDVAVRWSRSLAVGPVVAWRSSRTRPGGTSPRSSCRPTETRRCRRPTPRSASTWA